MQKLTRVIPNASSATENVPLQGRPARSNIDLRADRRYTVDVGGVLQVEGVPTAVYVVTVMDVSKLGLRVSCPVSIPVGTRVEVGCCDTTIFGQVRYASEVGPNDFYLGIRADKNGDGGLDLTLFMLPIARNI